MLYKSWLDPKAKDFELSLNHLYTEFKTRLNTPVVPSLQLNHQHLSYLKHLEAMLPEANLDPTEQKFFSLTIHEEEVADAKEHVLECNLNSAIGSDSISYKEIMDIPNENIASFLNFCVK
ncbi:hypothetical protein F5877DRAFT_55738, partial [Lentinula edodes]